MLTKEQAYAQLKVTLPGATIKACAPFQEFYLFRVEHPSVLEKDYDPFFSVDILTGEVRDFSVLTDMTADEFLALKWEEV
jgi:hypothetical protein